MSIFPCGLCCSVRVQFLSSSLQISKSSDKKFACDFQSHRPFSVYLYLPPRIRFPIGGKQVVHPKSVGQICESAGVKQILFFFHAVCSSFELGVITNLFMTGFTGNRELCFPTAFNVEGLGETNVPVTLRAIH